MTKDNTLDVIIIGGGPAGCAAAIALAQCGISVALIEKTRYDQTRIGETLLPAARVPLAKLGVWDEFLSDNHAPSPANISAWGESEIKENHFIYNPYGNGWHIDRARFDAMLACVAASVGVRVCRGTTTRDWSFEDNTWRVTLEDTSEIKARFLVDATGRTGILSRQMGAKRNQVDRLVGLVAISQSGSQDDNRTLVESAKDGWWYSATLPDERSIIAYMTDADLLPLSRAAEAECWQSRLMQTTFTKKRLNVETFEGSLQRLSAQSYIANSIVGKAWVAVGDAAFAFDPLSSQGIYNALESGLRAAEAIEQSFNGAEDGQGQFTAWAQSRFEKFLLKRKWYYNQEQRWSDSVFWKRRQTDKSDDR